MLFRNQVGKELQRITNDGGKVAISSVSCLAWFATSRTSCMNDQMAESFLIFYT